MLCALFSPSDGRVFVDAEGFLSHRSRSQAEGERRLIAGRFPECPEYVFLVSPDGGRLAVGADELHAPVLSYRLLDAGPDGAGHLRHPTRRLFLCASPTEENETAKLCCDREKAGGWEIFRLAGDRACAPGDAGGALLGCIARAFAAPPTAGATAEWLEREHGENLGACAAAVLRAMPSPLLKELAARAISDGSLRRSLEAVLLPAAVPRAHVAASH